MKIVVLLNKGRDQVVFEIANHDLPKDTVLSLEGYACEKVKA